MKLAAVSALLVAVHAGAAAQTFVMSKIGARGIVIAQHTVHLQDENDDEVSYSDTRQTALPECGDSAPGMTPVRSEPATVATVASVAVGTMLSVRRTPAQDRYVAAVFESKPSDGFCAPLVVGTRTVSNVRVVAGARVPFASQLEADGTKSHWWLERR